MTALTETEQATLDRIEAAPDAEESLRERVAVALMDAFYDQATGGLMQWSDLDGNEQGDFLRFADAAIAVMRGTR